MPQVHKKSVRGLSPILQFRPHTNIPLTGNIFWSFAEFTTHQPQFYSSLLDTISPVPWCPSTYTHTHTRDYTMGQIFWLLVGGSCSMPPRLYLQLSNESPGIPGLLIRTPYTLSSPSMLALHLLFFPLVGPIPFSMHEWLDDDDDEDDDAQGRHMACPACWGPAVS